MLENEDIDDDDEEEEIKVILLGSMETGKTELINKIVGLNLQDKFASTTTSSIVNKVMEIKGKKYSIDLWDTIGQEKYKSLTKIFIKGAKIIIFVYDISNRQTFNELNYWIERAKELINERTIMGLLGNKGESILKQEVKEEEGKQLAKDNGFEFAINSNKEPVFCEFLEKLVKKYIGLE